ncbi:YwqK superfamily antitoxin [Chromobacterium vaccinii]|nr:YwqK superfamily antitoxin [Chromobacterium vaccinii]QND88506.1 YwqK superfamily antitoxin [Chromobacterium vaccinii]
MKHVGLLSVVIAASLAGCSGRVLEFRNAEVVNGKIYKSGANEPFSGKVTNVPAAQIFRGLDGISAFLSTAKNVLGSPLDVSSLCTVEIQDGILDGKAECQQPNSSNLVMQLNFSQGLLDGNFKTFTPADPDQPVINATFNKGRANGKLEIFSPQTHKLIYHVNWENGSLVGTEEGFDANTGNLIARDQIENGKLQGEQIRYAPDGKRVIYRVKYVDGLKEGVEEAYDADSGKPTLRAEWTSGALNGTYQTWKDGVLDQDGKYEHGTEIQLSTAYDRERAKETAQPSDALNACQEAWVAAFRKASPNGDFALINQDQLAEWQQQCKQGKSPANT